MMLRRAVQALLVAVLAAVPLGKTAESHVLAASPPSPPATFSSGGTVLLRGTMTTRTTLTMTGAFSVGHAATLNWDLPLLISVQINGYSQQVRSVRYMFDVPPSSSTTLMVNGHTVRRFHWDAPPVNQVIHVTERADVTVRSDLSPFQSTVGYPLAQVSADVSPYLQVTPALQLSPAERSFVQGIAGRRASEQAVVEAVANWVASHTQYNVGQTVPYTAAWAMRHHLATCQGYDNLMAGMLRVLGIPARIVYGWVSPVPVHIPGPQHTTSYVQWGNPGSQGELHAWLNVYFPDSGWVPFDPQREKFFVDPRHVAFLTNVDAGEVHLGTWTADPIGNLNPAGATLSNGYVEVLPGFNMGGKVEVQGHDDFHLSLRQVHHDVTGVQLVSR